MTPVMCRVAHDPETGRYGDCLRACIATIMDLDAEDVPHFADGGVSADEAIGALRAWLAGHGCGYLWFGFPGTETVDQVLQWMGENNPGTTWLLFGSTSTTTECESRSDHVVVCQGSEVVHNPSWVPASIKQPGSNGFWNIGVVTKL